MSSKGQVESSDSPAKPCFRCGERPGELLARVNMLCKECFARYVKHKVMKPMGAFRVKVKSKRDESPKKLLLALSFGLSSLSLLHILTDRLKALIQTSGRYGFTLDVLFMEDMSVFRPSDRPEDQPVHRLWRLAELLKPADCPAITSFACRSTQLSFDSLGSMDNAGLASLLESLKLQSSGVAAAEAEVPAMAGPYERYMGSLTSLSAQVDANTVLTRRFIVEYARELGCQAILWGDTTTRLAERTLGEAAKGRGFSIPWQTADGPTPYGIDFMFPMREVLRKEIAAYASTTDPPLTSFTRQEIKLGSAQVSSKDATIDALMMQYFKSVEQNYPSIVTNVVRTSSKLDPEIISYEGRCEVCGLSVPRDGQGLHNWAGSRVDSRPASDEFLCYGCARTSEGRKMP